MSGPPRRPVSAARRALLLAALCASSLPACGGGLANDAGAGRPNVLLVSIDSLRRDHLSTYGHVNAFNKDAPTTPAIDRLGAGGVVFEHAVSTTSWTLPSHMALMTGLPDALHGVTDHHKSLSPALMTLPQFLREQGYATGGFFSGPYLSPVFGFGRGYDVYVDASQVDIDRTRFADPTPGSLKDVHRRSHKAITSPGLLSASSEWIRARVAADEQPFFAFVHWWDPHYDYVAPEPYGSMYATGYEGPVQGIHDREYRRDWTRKELAHLTSLYDAEVRYTDEHLGRLFDLLDELGIADETIVVVLADHGEEFYEYGRWGHQRTLDDVVVDIPLVWRFPGRVPVGVRPEGQARIQDVFPTLAELIGAEPPSYLEGKSLVPLWQAPEREGYEQHLYLDVPLREILLEGVADTRAKVIWQRSEGKGWVYDLTQEPGQLAVREFFNLKKNEDPAAVWAREVNGELRALRSSLPRGSEPLEIELENQMMDDLEGLGYTGEDEDE